MKALSSLSLGKLTAACTLLAVGVVIYVKGSQMFSPGALNAETRTSKTLGGVHSHAELVGRCSACHVSPWSSETMTGRCLACHEDVRMQLTTGKPVHGLMPNVGECRQCHTEHQGPHAGLTDLTSFDHSYTAFPLTGKHRSTSCVGCHVNNTYKETSQSCISCHAEPASHKARFSTDCASCHTTSSWGGAIFDHSFPLNHGRGKKGSSDCAVCHPSQGNQTPISYSTYTCYGCHKHDPVKTETKHLQKGLADMNNILQCALCHPTGRKKRP